MELHEKYWPVIRNALTDGPRRTVDVARLCAMTHTVADNLLNRMAEIWDIYQDETGYWQFAARRNKMPVQRRNIGQPLLRGNPTNGIGGSYVPAAGRIK